MNEWQWQRKWRSSRDHARKGQQRSKGYEWQHHGSGQQQKKQQQEQRERKHRRARSFVNASEALTAEQRKQLEQLENGSELRRVLLAKSHHDALGVTAGASAVAIKRAFIRLAHEVHPDKNASPLARDAFVRLSQAFEALTCAR